MTAKPKSKLRGCLVSLGIGVGLVALVVFVGRASFRKVGDRKLTEVTAKLDADEPGWRFEAIEAARKAAAPPPEENPAAAALGSLDGLPDTWNGLFTPNSAFGGYVANTRPGFWQYVNLLEVSAVAREVPARARERLLRPAVFNQPAGYIPLRHADNPFMILLPEVQKLRTVYSVLEVDAQAAALAGDPDRAIRDARAVLVATRAPGDEPILISQLVRMAGCGVACRTAMQALAWGEPEAGLAELQAELLAEDAHPGFLVGIRGERALMDTLYAGLESGKLGAKDLYILDDNNGIAKFPELLQEAGLRLYKGFLPGDRAECLRVLTAYVAAARLPLHEQKAAIAAVTLPPRPPESYRYLISSRILPAVDRVHAAHLRTRAHLRTAAVAIACERYRRQTGKWPDTLEDIPKSILPELPTDPQTGGPLGYKRLDDGVAVFGVNDEKPQATIAVHDDPMYFIGRGWRLWDPAARGIEKPAADLDFIPEPPADAPDGADGP